MHTSMALLHAVLIGSTPQAALFMHFAQAEHWRKTYRKEFIFHLLLHNVLVIWLRDCALPGLSGAGC